MMLSLLFIIALNTLNAFTVNHQIIKRNQLVVLASTEIDPNFEAHLPTLLKKGSLADRSSPDIANELRQRYKKITEVKRKASKTIGELNPELAIGKSKNRNICF